jgi:hypothetical protein
MLLLDESGSSCIDVAGRAAQRSSATCSLLELFFAANGSAVKLYLYSVFQPVGKLKGIGRNQFSNRLEN